ncbi:MAG: CAP domain-containing protein [Turicibacter sp.]|nr:CAP domain-containing protein [Turicibacter sp.]
MRKAPKLLLTSFIALAALAAATPTPLIAQAHEEKPKPPEVAEISLSRVEQLIFEKVNQVRAENGLAPLDYSPVMEKYARIKSKDMVERNYFGHGDPDGRLMQSMLDDDGVQYAIWGENLAKVGGYTVTDESLAQMFMDNWMKSTTHKANILSTDFSQIGVGIHRDGERFFATQEFLRP